MDGLTGSGYFGHFAGLETGSTDFHITHCTFMQNPYSLQIWQPTATGLLVRVAHVVAGCWSFSTDITSFGHSIIPS